MQQSLLLTKRAHKLAQLGAIQCIVMFAALCAPAKDSPPDHKQGVLVEGREYDPCHGDCFPLDRPTLYFCLQVDDRIVVGSRGADPAWLYDSSKMFALVGQAIAVRLDSHSLWITRPDKKEIHLRQDYSNDVFASQICSNEVRRHWLERFAHTPRPASVPKDAVLVPLSNRSYFWVRCEFDRQKNWDSCAEWNDKGERHPRDRELVNVATHSAVLDQNLIIDPLSTRNDFEIHLSNGVVLKDWAKGRINDVPATNSLPPVPPR
jgi:hypothetical protein